MSGEVQLQAGDIVTYRDGQWENGLPYVVNGRVIGVLRRRGEMVVEWADGFENCAIPLCSDGILYVNGEEPVRA